MRNYFIILFSLVAFTAQSQSIKLFYDNTEVVDTIPINMVGSETVEFVDIANLSANDIDLMIERTVFSILPDAVNTFCFGTCTLPDEDRLKFTAILPANDTLRKGDDTYFETDYDTKGKGGVSIIKFTFYDVNNPSDFAVVIFKFISETVGICNPNHDIVSTFEAYPNPTNSNVTIKHNFTNTNVENAQIVLSSLTGAIIETIAVSPFENETTLDISRLSQGIYFYSLQANGKTSVTKKLVVK